MLAVRFGIQYLSFVSQTIYQESTSHLEEVLHKSNNMLKEMVRKNVSYLHLYNCFLESTSDADAIQAYIEKAQQDIGFVDFYFLSYDGNYMTVNGETGYLGLQTNLDEKLADGEDIVMNTALPGKAQMLVFICPETQGSYRGFAYDAVAISYCGAEAAGQLCVSGQRQQLCDLPGWTGRHRQFRKPQENDLQLHCDAARLFRPFRGGDPHAFG